MPGMNPDTIQWLYDTNQPDYRARVKAALKLRKITMTQFASWCGCSPSNMSRHLTEGSMAVPVPKFIWEQARGWLHDTAKEREDQQ